MQAAVQWSSRLLGIDNALLQHSAFLLVATVAGQIISFGVQVFVANRIGVEAYGTYSYTWSWVVLMAMLAALGNERLVIRYGSEYGAQRQPGLVQGLLRWTLGRSVCLAVLLAAGFVAFHLALTNRAPGTHAVLAWSALAVVLLVVAGIIESVLRVHNALIWAAVPNRVIRPALMGILFFAFTFIPSIAGDARSAIASNTLAVLLSAAVSVIVLLPLIQRAAVENPPNQRQQWLKTSLAFGVNAIALHLSVTLDMLVLGMFHDDHVVGVYGAVQRFSVVMGFAGIAVITIIQPMLVRATAAGELRELQRLITGGARFVTLVCVSIGLPMIIFAEQLLGIFGTVFVQGADALRILVAGYVIAALVSLSSSILGMTGHERNATLVTACGSVVTLVLTLLLVPRFGLTGAATATSLSTIIWNLALFAMAWRRVGIFVAPLDGRFIFRVMQRCTSETSR